MKWCQVIVVLIGVAACNNKKADEAPSSGSALPKSPVPAADAAIAPRAPVAVDAAPIPDAAVAAADTTPQLPAGNILPQGETTPNTRVVIADGYRFQIPDGFKRVEHAGHDAYTGTLAGMVHGAPVTLWATVEPFAGDLTALVAREHEAAIAAGSAEPDLNRVFILVAGHAKENYARRMTITSTDRIELRTMVVHDKQAYVMHCETPNVANAWANVGADCVTRSTTFHVAPPSLEPPSPLGPAPARPDDVFYLNADFVGTARPKKVINKWLDDDVMPWVKPCFTKLQNKTKWFVAFDLGTDGKLTNVVVTGGPDGKPVPAEPRVVTCVSKVLDAVKLDGTAKAVVKVTNSFQVHDFNKDI